MAHDGSQERDAGADLLDHARTLVPEDDGQGCEVAEALRLLNAVLPTDGFREHALD